MIPGNHVLTRDYLDRRLLADFSDHIDATIERGLRRFKRDVMIWLLAMYVVFFGPLYVILLTRSGA